MQQLKDMGATRVLLALRVYAPTEEEQKQSLAELQENVAYLKDRGFKVGAWIWTFWYEGECEYTRMAFATGNVSKRFVCPSDEKFRAFVAANRHFMLDFATDIRKYLDETAPHVRLGLCACMSTWDFDGISPYELSKVLAGGTKPFLRLIGAPYWAVKQSWGNRLQNIKWLSGTELPAFCGGNPDLYVQTKRKGNALSVGLWNFFADAIAEPKILLDREYEEIRFVNCTGTVQGREVTLSKLHAYEFCGFEVK